MRTFGATAFLATWGAILSSIGFGWNLYRDLRDRAKLKVSVSLRRLVVGADGKTYSVKHNLPLNGTSEQVFVVITAVNTGRRPVKVKGWGGNYYNPVNGRRGFTIIPIDLPRMLMEGDDHTELTSELIMNMDNIKRLYVWDVSGKTWAVPRGALRNLKEEVRHNQVGTGTS